MQLKSSSSIAKLMFTTNASAEKTLSGKCANSSQKLKPKCVTSSGTLRLKCTASSDTLNYVSTIISPHRLEVGTSEEKKRNKGAKHIPKAEWIISPIINNKVEMMCCDGSDNIRTTGLDSLNSLFSCTVLQDDFQLLSPESASHL